ncbi:MAG TPA: SDR family NAD(P)-dependent oxidoreductase [Burkholderiaceae bacterium]|jgi:NAD(P)-dependent dehydrogenase (short-subunit alcohol dehydrogenase family)
MQKTIFITGCSSGIGAAMAKEFHRRGHVVYATARKLDSLTELAEAGMRTLAVDVNDDESIAAAFAVVASERGQIDVLVNNAGFSQVGALVDLSRDDLRRQYETNVIAPVAVIGAALGLLRAAKKHSGIDAVVANLGSIVGLVATPFAGAYCSSKAAIHSLSDVLRMELAPFGIKVMTIQPGGVQSSFGSHAEAAIRLPADSLYKPVEHGILARARAGQRGATPAEEFVRPIVDALLAGKHPVIRGGKNSFRLPLLKKLLPIATLDAKLSALFGLDRLKAR